MREYKNSVNIIIFASGGERVSVFTFKRSKWQTTAQEFKNELPTSAFALMNDKDINILINS